MRGPYPYLSDDVQDEEELRPAYTPGKAEGENGDVDPNVPTEEPIRRKRPSQAEGEDEEEE